MSALVTVHNFDSTHDAYDWANVGERDGVKISDGDVLVVESERVVGLLVEAWPATVTPERGSFHVLDRTESWDEFEGGRYAMSARVARAIAVANEWAVPTGGTRR